MSRILIVDDDEEILEFIKTQVESLGETAIVANGGQSALRLVEREKPDLVLLDVMMPDLNGIETLKKIRSRWPDIPVIMVTACDQVWERQKAMEEGAVDYITKPLDIDYFKFSIMSELLGEKAPTQGK